MFFTENQIKDRTTCEKCKSTFNDPRSLPCGECICNKCILNGINDQKIHGYICFCCGEIHDVPTDGFPVNKSMLAFLRMKPHGDIKFNVLEEFKKQLKNMKNNLENLTSNIDLSDTILNEHCEMVKNQIETRTDCLILKIEKYKEVLLKEVDEYQIKCEVNIKKEKRHFEKKMQENFELFNEYTGYLNKQNIDENILTEMNKSIIKQTEALEDEIDKFNSVIFNNNKIKFYDCIKDHIDSSKIGKIGSDSFASFDLKNYSGTIYLKSKIESLLSIEKTFIMENGSIIIVFKDRSNDHNICIFDQNQILKKSCKISSLFNYCKFQPACYSVGNQILFNYYDGVFDKDRLMTIDQELITRNNVSCRKYYTLMCGNSEKIIGSFAGVLDIYNSNLSFLQTVDHTINSLPYFHLSVTTEILISNDNYILKCFNNIKIVNIASGIQEASIDVICNQIVVKDNKIYIVAKIVSKYELQIYNSNGHLERTFALTGLKKDCLLSLNFKNKIDFLLNNKTLIINKY
jgi:hypothetical protein